MSLTILSVWVDILKFPGLSELKADLEGGVLQAAATPLAYSRPSFDAHDYSPEFGIEKRLIRHIADLL